MTDALGSAMSVVLFIGSANAMATPEQRQRMKDEALPPLHDKSLSASQAYRAAMEKTIEIMGPDWVPGDEWLTVIENFLRPYDKP